MQLSPDQDAARQAILAALSGEEQVVVLVGPAGSGKTTLLRSLLSGVSREVALLCPTGKAAARLAEVTGRRARTIHRALYGRVTEVSGASGTRLVFDGKQAPCPPGGLVICDEASMVDTRLHRDLLDHLPSGAQILYVGDREQLPPVEGTWGPDFDAPTAVLETIHRQAEQSPILSLATAIRQGQRWDGWQEGVCERSTGGDPVGWLLERQGTDATLITATNRRRRALNAGVRERLGHTEVLHEGEHIVCLANNIDVGLMNGEVRRVLSAQKAPGPSWIHRAELWEVLLEGGLTVMVNTDLIGEPVSVFNAWKRKKRGGNMERVIHIDFGYCLTVHKAQGSQWEQVGFVSCPVFRRMKDRRRLAYTAVTRASDVLQIFLEG